MAARQKAVDLLNLSRGTAASIFTYFVSGTGSEADSLWLSDMGEQQVIVVCPMDWLPCINTTRCYRPSWACDGFAHCPLSDDELGCRECITYIILMLVNLIG